jgi:uncharacterized integral membrane protein
VRRILSILFLQLIQWVIDQIGVFSVRADIRADLIDLTLDHLRFIKIKCVRIMTSRRRTAFSDREDRDEWQTIFGLILIGISVLFVLQNMDIANLRFFFCSLSMSAAGKLIFLAPGNSHRSKADVPQPAFSTRSCLSSLPR